MYEIDFYADRKGNVPVREYIKKLAGKKDKNSRIKLNKIRDYIRALASTGRRLVSRI